MSGSTSATAVHDTLAIELEVLYMSGIASPSQPNLSGSSTSATEPTMVDDTFAAGHDMLQFLSTSSSAAGPSHPTFDCASTSTAEFTMVDDTLATGYEASQFSSPMLGPSQPIFDLGASNPAAANKLAAELDDELTAELKALIYPSAPSGGTIQFTKNGSRRKRRAKASSRQMLANKSSSYSPIQREPNLTAASFPLGSDSQPSMVTFNPFSPGDRAMDVSDAPAMGSYPFSFKFNGLASAGNVNAPQSLTSVSGIIGGTSNPFNDARTSNIFGRAMIGANKQAEIVLSTQMSKLLFDPGMTDSCPG